jgi:hypothetical protein
MHQTCIFHSSTFILFLYIWSKFIIFDFDQKLIDILIQEGVSICRTIELEHLHRRPQNASQKGPDVLFSLGGGNEATSAAPKGCRCVLEPNK